MMFAGGTASGRMGGGSIGLISFAGSGAAAIVGEGYVLPVNNADKGATPGITPRYQAPPPVSVGTTKPPASHGHVLRLAFCLVACAAGCEATVRGALAVGTVSPACIDSTSTSCAGMALIVETGLACVAVGVTGTGFAIGWVGLGAGVASAGTTGAGLPTGTDSCAGTGVGDCEAPQCGQNFAPGFTGLAQALQILARASNVTAFPHC